MPVTVDVALLESRGEDLVLNLGNSSGSAGLLVSGPAKLAQRVLLELFTEKGSLLYASTRGTTLARELRLRRFQSEYDVAVAVQAALVDLERNLSAEENGTEPADERLDKVSLERLVLVPGALVLSLRVQSQAGTTIRLSLPWELHF